MDVRIAGCECVVGEVVIADPFFAPLAQLVEQLTLNQEVLGSSPRRGTVSQ